MHILIIPSGHFLTLLYPLAGIFEYHQAIALKEVGHQVGIISSNIITSRFIFKDYPYLKFEEKMGINVLRNYVRKIYPQRWMSFRRRIALIEKISIENYHLYVKKYGKPDIIHAHGINFGAFVAHLIYRIDKIPYVITEHSSFFIHGKRLLSRSKILMSEVIERASEMIAVSSTLAAAIQEQIPVKKIKVLPNLVDSMVLKAPLIKSSKSTFVFLNIASLDDNKNQASLIEAFAQNFRGKPVVLRLGGNGPREIYLKKLIRRLGIDDQVYFLGFLDRSSVISEMQAADCFVLPSKHETFGVVLIESLASGTPVIATRCGGPEDIVNEKNGLLIDKNNSTLLGNAMVLMIENRGFYHAENLRESCKAFFGKEKFLSQINDIYQQVCGVHG